MLAVFNRSIVRLPTAMRNQDSALLTDSTHPDYFLAHHFLKYYPQAITVKFGKSGFLAIDDCPRRRMIESQECVFCLFTGKLENKDNLLKDLKLTETASDPHIITEMYKMSKKEGRHIVNSSLSEAEGSFSFILYDSTCGYVAIGLDADGSLPLYWGTDFAENVVVTNFLPMAVQKCVKSYAPFPSGSVYTSLDGLMKFKRPLSKLEPVPWKDSKGQVHGVTFRIKDEIRRIYPSVCNNPKPKQ